MSKMSQHAHEIQQSDDYQFGWQSAERNEPRPEWKVIPGAHAQKLERQRMGWDDYHNSERSL